MSTSQRFLDRLGLQHPLIQAPMAGVSTPRMAAAVSNAGGLGSLAIGAGNVAQARQAIADTRALTDRPFNVNVFCHAPAVRDARREAAWLAHLAPLFAELGAAVPTELDEIYQTFLANEAAFALLLELRPAVVSFHFGLPAQQQIAALRQAGVYTMATATNVREAALIEQAGVDAIVAQGVEAGGHRGVFDPQAPDERHSTSVLLRLLAGRTALPLIAAGGIMDGQGVRAALDLGAAAAQLGTAFVLCPESSANAGYRANLQSERAASTRLTSVLSGRLARGMVNRLIEHGEAPGSPPPADYPVAYDAAKQLNALASRHGHSEFAAQWAGQGAPLAREIGAEELVSALAREMAA
ncbi:nitronate monooxygenase [Janthinobacterium sp. GW460P]|uniref:NAD(P)H-dependent flavin oxidoreductase n=1 Tax=unclassified Janthinobacterium TaxID=2610881 RepID=UPI000A327C51|nr:MULTISPECIES: nitronate monooxygenase [unclassified Janthinobacterium]MCC7705517.1 nitronate monooxygenase [Janthinobacterium sp. GW460P]MCC7711035.1 nitronate monooxygenase [Janthinobacterium sp. GW460W]